MTKTTGIGTALLAAAISWQVWISAKNQSGEVLVPSISFIHARQTNPVWLVINRTPDDYVLYWELRRADGSPALGDFIVPAGSVWLPKGGGIVNLKLQLTERARASTYSGERFQLVVREMTGRFETRSAVIINKEPGESARL